MLAGSSPGIIIRTMPTRPRVQAYRETSRWSRTTVIRMTAPTTATSVQASCRPPMPLKTGLGALVRGVGRQVEPAQESHADAVEQGHRRQQGRVGVRGEEPQRDVGGEEQPGEHRDRHPEVGGEGVQQVHLDHAPSAASTSIASRAAASSALRRAAAHAARHPGRGRRGRTGGRGHGVLRLGDGAQRPAGPARSTGGGAGGGRAVRVGGAACRAGGAPARGAAAVVGGRRTAGRRRHRLGVAWARADRLEIGLGRLALIRSIASCGESAVGRMPCFTRSWATR